MDANETVKYIRSWVITQSTPKQYRQLVSGPLLLVFMIGLVIGVVMKGFWLALTVIMIITSLAAVISVFILSRKPLNIQVRLIIDIIIYSNWCLQILLMETQIFTEAYGFNIAVLLLYVPVICIPLILGRKNAKKLQSGELKTHTTSHKSHWAIGGAGGVGGLLGIALAKEFFQNISQNTAVNVGLICFTIVASLMSMGLISIQMLYYFQKLKKQGINCDYDVK